MSAARAEVHARPRPGRAGPGALAGGIVRATLLQGARERYAPGRDVRRRIFIGDIQGCREELERLLEKLRYDPAGDELQPVGDLVNRGPDNLGVLRLMRSLGAKGVLGNHDLHLLRTSRGTRPLRPRDTLGDVLASDERDELVAWLAARPFLRRWKDAYLVHAGLHPKWKSPAKKLEGANPFEPDEEARFAISVRTCDAEGRLPETEDGRSSERYRPWYEFYRPEEHEDRTVVFGHWSMRGLIHDTGLRGLDTGCVWGGQLSAWIAEDDRIVQVGAKRAYQPVDA